MIPYLAYELVLLIVNIPCFPLLGFLPYPVPRAVIPIAGAGVSIPFLRQLSPDVIAVSDLDLLVPAIGRSLFPALCDSVPVAIILITEREQDLLPGLCLQEAYIPVPVIFITGMYVVPVSYLLHPVQAVIPIPDFQIQAQTVPFNPSTDS